MYKTKILVFPCIHFPFYLHITYANTTGREKGEHMGKEREQELGDKTRCFITKFFPEKSTHAFTHLRQEAHDRPKYRHHQGPTWWTMCYIRDT